MKPMANTWPIQKAYSNLPSLTCSAGVMAGYECPPIMFICDPITTATPAATLRNCASSSLTQFHKKTRIVKRLSKQGEHNTDRCRHDEDVVDGNASG